MTFYRREGVHTNKWKANHFVAWDGEGANLHGPDAPQDYVYLACWDHQLGAGDDMVDLDGMAGEDALRFFMGGALTVGKDATHVCFGVSYDANMWLAGATRAQLTEIWKGQFVEVFGGFKVKYIPRKSFWVKDLSSRFSATLWDPYGFFQSSFVKAVVDNLGPDDPRLPNIRKGKKARPTFTAADLPFIRTYTHDELTALCDLMVNLRAAFDAAGLKLQRWDGAGAGAAALMRRYRVRDHITDPNDEVRLASLIAYGGGHIETPRYGFHDATIYHGDINSAYPFAATLMPSLTHGTWHHLDGPSAQQFSIGLVEWDFSRLGYDWPILPFKLRAHDGAIYYPRRGHAWTWKPEIDAALEHDELKRRCKVLESWEFRPDDPRYHPFSWLRDVYEERQRLKKDPDPFRRGAQKALKLSMNSVSGKFAQTVGTRKTKEGALIPPVFHQREYAGFITSVTRAMLFRAAAPVRRHVVTLATDGIFSTAPLNLVEGSDLGEWEYKEHDAMLIAQSGVYWYRNHVEDPRRCPECGTRTRATFMSSVACPNDACRWSNLVHHYRGFDESSLDPDMILAAWKRRETSVVARETRFVTLGTAHLTDERFKDWRKWITAEKNLDVRAIGKRTDRIDPSLWTRRYSPAVRLVDTDPTDPFEIESHPYTSKGAEEWSVEGNDAQEQVSL